MCANKRPSPSTPDPLINTFGYAAVPTPFITDSVGNVMFYVRKDAEPDLQLGTEYTPESGYRIIFKWSDAEDGVGSSWSVAGLVRYISMFESEGVTWPWFDGAKQVVKLAVEANRLAEEAGWPEDGIDLEAISGKDKSK